MKYFVSPGWLTSPNWNFFTSRVEYFRLPPVAWPRKEAPSASNLLRGATRYLFAKGAGIPILLDGTGFPVVLESNTADLPPFDFQSPPVMWITEYRGLQSFLTKNRPAAILFFDGPPPKTGGRGGQGSNPADHGGKAQTETEGGGKSPKPPRVSRVNGGSGKASLALPVEWGKPDPALCREAARIFRRLVDDADTGIEVAPNRWNYRELAVRAETGNPFPARLWEKQATPTLLLGVDNSGSVGEGWREIVLAANAIATTFPQVVVCTAWNGEPLYTSLWEPGGPKAIWGGRPWMPSLDLSGKTEKTRKDEDEENRDTWKRIATETGAVAAIYLGDDYGINFAAALSEIMPGRVYYLSNFNSTKRPPYRSKTRWGTAVRSASGAGTGAQIIQALDLLL